MNDPLSQSSGSNWQTSGGTCRFSDQAYHVKTPAINSLNACYGQTTKFQNLTYQVDMTILQGAGVTASIIPGVSITLTAQQACRVPVTGLNAK